ncbi:MAG: biopolymer transport protein ExbB/TolQ [Kiritimatiellia bacterium]|jgi:biopolymer transport protein ExbB/TolQ
MMMLFEALGPVWCLLFLFVFGEWTWHLVMLKHLLRDLPVRPSAAYLALERRASALEAIPGRAMLYGILGTAVGMVQALGAIEAGAPSGDIVASLLGPGAGTTLALLSTAVGLVLADLTARFARPILSRVDATLWTMEHPEVARGEA